MVSDERRRQILAMSPEDRAVLASVIRRERDKLPGRIAQLQAELRGLDEWLAEFAPMLAGEDRQAQPGSG